MLHLCFSSSTLLVSSLEIFGEKNPKHGHLCLHFHWNYKKIIHQKWLTKELAFYLFNFSYHSTSRFTELTWYKMCRYNLGLRFCKTLVRNLWQYDAHICQTFPFLSTWLHKQWQRWWRYSYFSVKKSGSKVLSIYDMEYITTSPAGDCYNLPYWLLSLKTLANDERK